MDLIWELQSSHSEIIQRLLCTKITEGTVLWVWRILALELKLKVNTVVFSHSVALLKMTMPS